MYLEIPPKIGKKVGIHFYKNIPSETNLPSWQIVALNDKIY